LVVITGRMSDNGINFGVFVTVANSEQASTGDDNGVLFSVDT